jgi:hypothetical protein
VARLPSFLEPLASDEYAPPRSLRATSGRAPPRASAGSHMRCAPAVAPGAYRAGRRGTATGLRAINAAAGRTWYEVPAEAELEDAPRPLLRGRRAVIDVQTHFVADRPECARWNRSLARDVHGVAPHWWRGLDD